jgi:uncharacterized protein YhaN
VRIRRLYLKAFGPFTETVLDFPDLDGVSGPGLCVVHGSNEIGKTSALRAIRDLLYGIPVQSPDDFKHAYGRMRIGAQVVFQDGEEFAFLRRKRAKATLIAYETESDSDSDSGAGAEEPIESPRLDELLRAVPQSLFNHFYGLDHAGLSRGSEALLEDEGELGRALFSAGLGTGNLRAVLSGLEQEADDLFKPRGTTPSLNAKLAEVKALKSSIKISALKPSAWKEAEKAVVAIEAELGRLETAIEQAYAERARLRRIRLTHPALARLRRAQEIFAPLAENRELENDFETRLRDTRMLAESARQRRDRALETIDRLNARLAALDLAPDVIAQREGIESLGERIGAYRDLIDQLPRRKVEGLRLDGRIDSILESIGSDDSPASLAELRASLARSGRIRELGTAFVGTKTRHAQAAEDLDKARALMARRKEELERFEEPPDPASLRRALDRAQRLGEIDDRVSQLSSTLEASEAACAHGFERLGFWSGPLSEIDRVAFPAVETIDEYQKRFDAIDRREELLAVEQDRVTAEGREAREQLSRLRRERAVPSEADRDTQRQARDATWKRIRSDWIDVGAREARPFDRVLPDQFEAEMAAADDVADRLRNEAERVAQESQLVARLERIDADLEAHERTKAQLTVLRAEADEAWELSWRPVDVVPGTPAEMRGWLARLGRLRDAFLAIEEDRRELDGLRADRDAARESLEGELAAIESEAKTRPVATGAGDESPGQRLDLRIESGEEIASAFESGRRVAARLREDLSKATEDFEESERIHRACEVGIQSWNREWAEAIEGLGLADDCRPRDAEDRLEILAQLGERIRERDQLAERIEKMEAEIERFARDVAEIAPRCAPDLEVQSPDQAVVDLRTLLAQASEQDATRCEIEGLLLSSREERVAAENLERKSSEDLAALCEEAGVQSEAELESAVLQSQKIGEARRGLEEAETQIAERGEGRSVSELEAEAKDIDPDLIPARLERFEVEIGDFEKARDAAQQERFRLREVLARMDGSAEVARLAEEVQDRCASIDTDLRRYVTLTLARKVLGREIERYRERNQTPVLGRAGELFAALTCASYRGVRSEFDDADRRQLVAVDAEGQLKNMAALSSGTRDQLFLALRLATLEEALERGEPMPFIADDILVEFDEDRSRAALDVLARLGRRTQILLFSHHAHIADQARELGDHACVVDL